MIAIKMMTTDLERIGDIARNIAEEVILVAEAENVKHQEKLAQSR